ncbi:AAA family ATPase [Ruegeria sp. 2012CJ41-6]|uniref:AAA family ATPase n=1 Tax=Ruegeria spongiae TaxID=2942209 RepID=A0ABT0Q6C2_9RHOB|nr:AAA family ATPase [Ruegeria spongiae]MCL6285378.1 AAA family ATPase [Ruegeria spongiae]
MTPRRIVLSGCSGAGKSTLLQEMARRGYVTVPEPGRRIIAQERLSGGQVLPWVEPVAFCRRAMEMAMDDMKRARGDLVLFDRCALDALIWFDRTQTPLTQKMRESVLALGYDCHVYLTPPWPEIYENDGDRRHGLRDALAEFDALCDRLPHYGFKTVLVPKGPVSERADWFEAQLNEGAAA